MTDEDRGLTEILHRAVDSMDADDKVTLDLVTRPQRYVSKRSSLVLGAILGVFAVGIMVVVLRPDEPVQPAATSPQPSVVPRCESSNLRPTYLPWGGEAAEPYESYDEEIDRAQLLWTAPDATDESQVGLSVYPLESEGGQGTATDIVVQGQPTRLHADDEGGVVGLSWTEPNQRCNYYELTLYAPSLNKRAAVDELTKIAKSLQGS